MNIEEFRKTNFFANSVVIYDDEKREVVSVDFCES